MKKTVLIVGGSHCYGCFNNSGVNDWINLLSLHFNIKVMAIPGTSNQSCKLMLDHYLQHHEKPDYVVFEVMPFNRVDMGVQGKSILIDKIDNNKRWCRSRKQHHYECGCEFPEPNKDIKWSTHILSDIRDAVKTWHPNFARWLEYGILYDILPNVDDRIYVEASFLKLKNLDIPFSWLVLFKNAETNIIPNILKDIVTEFKQPIDPNFYIGGSKSPNHMSIEENKILYNHVLAEINDSIR